MNRKEFVKEVVHNNPKYSETDFNAFMRVFFSELEKATKKEKVVFKRFGIFKLVTHKPRTISSPFCKVKKDIVPEPKIKFIATKRNKREQKNV